MIKKKIKPDIYFETNFKDAASIIEADGFYLVYGKNIISPENGGVTEKRVYWHNLGLLIQMESCDSDINKKEKTIKKGLIYTNLVSGTKKIHKVSLLRSGVSGAVIPRGDGTFTSCYNFNLKNNYRNLMEILEKKQLKICLPWIRNNIENDVEKDVENNIKNFPLYPEIKKIMGPVYNELDTTLPAYQCKGNIYWNELILRALKREKKIKPLNSDAKIYQSWSKFILTPKNINETHFSKEFLSPSTSLGHNILHIIPFIENLQVKDKLTCSILKIFSTKEITERLNQGDANGLTAFLNLVKLSSNDLVNDKETEEGAKLAANTWKTMEKMMIRCGKKIKLVNPFYTFLNAACSFKSKNFPKIIDCANEHKLNIPWVLYQFDRDRSSLKFISKSFKRQEKVLDVIDQYYGASFNATEKIRCNNIYMNLSKGIPHLPLNVKSKI